jgi:N-acetylglutamate synthase-like GNAT family acetyltransferase
LPDIILRPARQEDSDEIKAIIHLVRINPMGLDWRRFLLACLADGEVVACAQVKPHADGTLELASLAVRPAWRSRGLARRLIEQLLSQSPRPIYLTCRTGLGVFYKNFGFHALASDELTPYFHRIKRLADVFLYRKDESLLIMRRDD